MLSLVLNRPRRGRRRGLSHVGLLAGGLLVLATGAGCEMTRPKGAFQPKPLSPDTLVFDGAVPDTEEDAGGIPVLPSVPPDGGMGGPDGDTPANPLARLQGDYMLQFDNETETRDPQLGLIESTTTTRGVMRVVLDGDTLKGTEWLCSSTNTQTAENGTISTTFLDPVWNAFTPVTRELVVDEEAGTWQAAKGTRRQGWKPVTSNQLPTDPNQRQEDVLDPDEDGQPGMRVTIRADYMPPIGPRVRGTCLFDVFAFTTSHYDTGRIVDGELVSAKVRLDNSRAHAWRLDDKSSAVCDLDQINDAKDPDVKRDELQLARLPVPLTPTMDDPKPCPDPATFDQAF